MYVHVSMVSTCSCPPSRPQSTVMSALSLKLSLAPVGLYFNPNRTSPTNGHDSGWGH